MVRRLIAVTLAAFLPMVLGAQNYKVSVKLQDASSGAPIEFATVSLASDKGGTPKYSLTDTHGTGVIEKVKKGSYTFKAEIMGYVTAQKKVSVEKDTDLGVVKMELDSKVLDAASVSATGNPIIIKKDTVEYNASSFKISEDNMLVDLLKKLPGIEVSEDGTITSNGETISKITIAGKTFFLDDPQLASQNIPAKLVEKVKVVKKKSEQAEFTGIDDGEEETVIDLSVKRGMMNGVFGNAMAGGGHDLPSKAGAVDDWRWQSAFMGGKFTEKSQLSIIANANNTNNRGFNDLSGSMMNSMMGSGGGMGRRGGGWGNSNGITTSWMGGVNGNWDLFGKKMDLGGNYLYNGSIIDVEESTYKETYLADGTTLISNTDGSSHRFTDGHRFGVRLDHKFSENTSILFQPQFNFGRGSFLQQSVFDTEKELADGTTSKTNDGFIRNTGDNTNMQARGFLLLRQRLGMPGRTISANVDWNISKNSLDGNNRSLTNNSFDADGNVLDYEAVNQLIRQKSNSQAVGTRIVYTEPLGGNFYFEGSYNGRWSQSVTEKNVYDSDSGYPLTLDGMEYIPANPELFNDTYSNSILNRAITNRGGAAFMYQKDKARAQLGISAIHTNTHNETKGYDPYDDKRWNWAPRAMVFFDFNENANIRLFYWGRSSQPSTSQLLPVMDNSNPLAMSLGNPNLSPYFNHGLRSDLEYSNKQTFFTARLHVEGNYTQNPIVSALWYDNAGVQYSVPVNGRDSYSGNARLMVNAPIAKSNFSLSNITRVTYSSSSSYVGSAMDMTGYFKTASEASESGGSVGDFNYDKFFADYPDLEKATGFSPNITTTVNFIERIRATYRSDDVEVILSGRTRVNKSWYSIGTTLDPTFSNQIRSSFKWTVGRSGFEVSTDADYNWYRGYTTPQPSEFVWNASLSQQLFRKQATLSLKAYDILDQAKNLTVSDTANYHQEVRNNTLGRYIILSFTWRFGNFGKAGQQMRSRMGGGPGGMGMGMGRRPF